MNTKEEVSFDIPTNYFPAEPVFVPRNNPPSADDDEDDGVLLVGGYSSENKKGKPFNSKHLQFWDAEFIHFTLRNRYRE